MGSVQALDWLFSSPATFLFTMVFIMVIITLLSTRNYKTSLLVGVLTLTYGGLGGNQYVSGLMYVTIVGIALMLSNKVYNAVMGGEREV